MTPSQSEPSTWPVFRAPTGLEFFHHSRAETGYVYKEIFEERVYFRHGITLGKGDCVFDVGANIGLFTLFVQETFKEVQVHAFEPCPDILSILRANVSRYGDKVVPHPYGISDQPGEAEFTFYPRYSIMSGFHAQEAQDTKTIRAGIRNRLRERNAANAEIRDQYVDWLVQKALSEKKEYLCQLRSLSGIIRQERIREISLLKVDAEGSELNVLQGISDEDWPRIQQVVMEIHDPDGTLAPHVKELLEIHGFTCIFEQEQRLSGAGVANCYAARR
jgi:FkbM family methyltransferase